MIEIKNCPGTLATGHQTYSSTCLKRMFSNKKVSHILPYDSPSSAHQLSDIFLENHNRISISGVQEKYSVILEKNKLRLVEKGEKGSHILKPIPKIGNNLDQMPANEHLTMQIARQVYKIETAENAVIFFRNGDLAYITKRFDFHEDGSKIPIEDFASLAMRTPQTHGGDYKYQGHYLEMFELIQKYLPAFKLEAPKLFSLILFNYLFSNGDAHFKNFSLLETSLGDFRLSPAYDLLNTRIHIKDSDFALKDKLIPRHLVTGNIRKQFELLADLAGINPKQKEAIFENLLSKSNKVESLVNASFLQPKFKRNYLQAYQKRLKKLQYA